MGWGRLRQHFGLMVKGKRISCPPHYAPPHNGDDPPHHDYEHDFPLIRSLRASTQRSTSVLFSFVLSLLIMAGSFAVRQSKTILARSCAAAEGHFRIDRLKGIWQARVTMNRATLAILAALSASI